MNSAHATVTAALGRWFEILPVLGIADSHLTRNHGPCPGCGGKDRFRFDDRDGRGTFVCSQGGNGTLAGDGFQLIEHVFGVDRGESFAMVRRALGVDAPDWNPSPRRPIRPPEPPEPPRTQSYALALWAAVRRDDAHVAGHAYAARKHVTWAAGAGRTAASGRIIGRDTDCLVIPIRTIPELTVAAVQCITPDGRKQTFGPVKGNAFAIGDPRDRRAQWFVVEGWADAASLFRAVRRSVVFAAMGKEFDALAGRIAEAYAPPRLVLLEDAQ